MIHPLDPAILNKLKKTPEELIKVRFASGDTLQATTSEDLPPFSAVHVTGESEPYAATKIDYSLAFAHEAEIYNGWLAYNPRPVASSATGTFEIINALPASGSQSFTYTGTVEEFVVPEGVTEIFIDMAGAQGGYSYDPNEAGLGGRTRALITVTPGEMLRIRTGGAGSATSGGFNGGGNGSSGSVPGGGGASDIRRSADTLQDRICVAGAGGGGEITGHGGHGGLIGENGGGGSFGGRGATLASGGAGGTGGAGTPGDAGTIGQGGNGGSWGCGGGGGYFGGGGGGYDEYAGIAVAGGGGSSYADGSAEFTTGYQSGDGYIDIYWGAAIPNAELEVGGAQLFEYTGSPENFTVPVGVSELYIDMAGAQGGSQWSNGGQGARVETTLSVTSGETLRIRVGQQGGSGHTEATSLGGYNGGGNGGLASWGDPEHGSGGGGATDIRTNDDTFASRVVIAGGGGGSSRFAPGGDSGQNGQAGQNGDSTTGGGGATSSAGGTGGGSVAAQKGDDGILGQGGNGGPLTAYDRDFGGGGGGGGAYGGGGGEGSWAGGPQPAGGGGGSSYGPVGTTYTTGYQSGDGYCIIAWGWGIPA